MNFDDLVREWLRDPLGFFVLSYLLIGRRGRRG
jgi:hypothetical protein